MNRAWSRLRWRSAWWSRRKAGAECRSCRAADPYPPRLRIYPANLIATTAVLPFGEQPYPVNTTDTPSTAETTLIHLCATAAAGPLFCSLGDAIRYASPRTKNARPPDLVSAPLRRGRRDPSQAQRRRRGRGRPGRTGSAIHLAEALRIGVTIPPAGAASRTGGHAGRPLDLVLDRVRERHLDDPLCAPGARLIAAGRKVSPGHTRDTSCRLSL